MNFARKSLTAVLGAAVIAGGAFVSTDAEAGHRGRHHGDRSGAVVAGVIGGLAIGALAAAAASRSSRTYADTYHYPSSGYYPAHSGYRSASSWQDGYGYQTPAPQCFKQRRPVYDRWGQYVGTQKVRVCH